MDVKYPKSMHLPWSPGLQNDDRLIESLDGFIGQEVVVTVKMDGENTTMTRDHIHARSLDSRNHPSRNWVRGLHGKIKQDIPDGWRFCGENLYAKHAIYYNNLPSYFMLFNIWDDCNFALSLDDTIVWADLLGLATVPVLWRGIWHEDKVKSLYHPSDGENEMEGYVVRVTRSFHSDEFQTVLAKYVRKGHVQANSDHWMSEMIIQNGLRS